MGRNMAGWTSRAKNQKKGGTGASPWALAQGGGEEGGPQRARWAGLLGSIERVNEAWSCSCSNEAEARSGSVQRNMAAGRRPILGATQEDLARRLQGLGEAPGRSGGGSGHGERRDAGGAWSTGAGRGVAVLFSEETETAAGV